MMQPVSKSAASAILMAIMVAHSTSIALDIDPQQRLIAVGRTEVAQVRNHRYFHAIRGERDVELRPVPVVAAPAAANDGGLDLRSWQSRIEPRTGGTCTRKGDVVERNGSNNIDSFGSAARPGKAGLATATVTC